MKLLNTLITCILSQFLVTQYYCQGTRNPSKTDPNTVIISDQLWMSKNLNVTYFSNGDLIKESKTFDDWKKALNNGEPSWCYYNFDSLNENTFGKLYNWYAVNDQRGIAPKGWKVPSPMDWEKLVKNLGKKFPYYSSIDELLMSSSQNWKDKQIGTNLSSFNAEPSGYVETNNFSSLGEIAYFWSSDSSKSVYLQFYYSSFTLRTGACMDAFDGSGFAIRCISEESVPIDKNEHIQFDNPYFEDMKYIDQRFSTTIGNVINTDQKDSLLYYNLYESTYLKPFYLSDHEITNGEYKAFVNWVRDSIARDKLYRRITGKEKKKWGEETSSKLKGYSLNWETEIDYTDRETSFLLSDMFYNSNYNLDNPLKDIDTRLFFYDYYDEQGEKYRINVYPDTLASTRELPFTDDYFTNYFWNSQYSNYPVVGITYNQAKAYCVWRTHMYEFERAKKNQPFLSVTFRLPTHEEWDQAAVDDAPRFQRISENETNGYLANYGKTYLSSGLIVKYAADDNYLRQCLKYSYKPNYYGLYNMYGNVSEWVNVDLSQQNFHMNYCAFDHYFPKENKNSKVEIYITNPYDGKTSKVIKGSPEHREIIEKRMRYYRITPDLSDEDALQLFLKFHSIDPKYRDSILIDTNAKLHYFGHDMLYKSFFLKPSDTLYNVLYGTYELHNFKIEDKYYQNLNFLDDFNKFKQNQSSLNHLKMLQESSDYPWDVSTQNRLVCGGSWIDPAHYLIPGISKVVQEHYTSITIGFRVAADMEGYVIPKEAQKRHKKEKKKKKDDWIFNEK